MQIFYIKVMKKSIQAFTLVEILFVITIIGVLALGISRVNFSRISQVELLNTESIKLLTSIEEMRNNALVWRAVSDWVVIPDFWSIAFTNENTYTRWYDTEVINQTEMRTPFIVQSISCSNIDFTQTWLVSDITNTDIRFYSWGETIITSCPSSIANPAILDIEIWFWDILKTIRINTITNVIEET